MLFTIEYKSEYFSYLVNYLHVWTKCAPQGQDYISLRRLIHANTYQICSTYNSVEAKLFYKHVL